jgi:hypothetical protein
LKGWASGSSFNRHIYCLGTTSRANDSDCGRAVVVVDVIDGDVADIRQFTTDVKSTTIASLLRSIAGEGSEAAAFPSARILLLNIHSEYAPISLNDPITLDGIAGYYIN